MRLVFSVLFWASAALLFSQLPNSHADIPPQLKEDVVCWFPLMDHFEDISGEPIVGIPSPSGLGFEAADDTGIPFQSYTSFSGGVVDLGSPERLMWPLLKPGAFSVWFRPQGTGANGRLYSAENNECCGDIEFNAYSSTAEAAAIVVNMLGMSTIISVPYEDWTHMVISANSIGTDSVQCSMYLNGDLFLEQSPAPANYDLSPNLPNGYDDMFIGQKAASAWDKWGGDAAHMAWFNRGLTLDEINYLFTGNLSVGCTDSTACNYNNTATEESGNCDYSCCPGPGCCDEGLHWNWQVGLCQITNPSDSNFDSCVQLNDLLDLLSAYGTCGWQCGDPVSYEGYNYATVQIGEQCWFAENARYLPFVGGGFQEESPSVSVYGYSGNSVDEAKSTYEYESFGALYNFPAVESVAICPTGWHVPTKQEFDILFDEYGGVEVAHLSMMDVETWNLDLDAVNLGYDVLPAGWLYLSFQRIQEAAFMWTSSPYGSNDPRRFEWNIQADNNFIVTYEGASQASGKSVRCIKDVE